MDARGPQSFQTSLLQKEEEKWNESWRGRGVTCSFSVKDVRGNCMFMGCWEKLSARHGPRTLTSEWALVLKGDLVSKPPA